MKVLVGKIVRALVSNFPLPKNQHQRNSPISDYINIANYLAPKFGAIRLYTTDDISLSIHVALWLPSEQVCTLQ